MKTLGTVLISVFGLWLMIAGASAATDPENQQMPVEESEEDQIHALSVYSFIQSLRRRSWPRPVLVTVNVKGRAALEEFCHHQPRILEAVLRVVGWGKLRRGGTDAYREPLLRAITDILPDATVQGLEIRMAWIVSDFGPALLETRKICKELDE